MLGRINQNVPDVLRFLDVMSDAEIQIFFFFNSGSQDQLFLTLADKSLCIPLLCFLVLLNMKKNKTYLRDIWNKDEPSKHFKRVRKVL